MEGALFSALLFIMKEKLLEHKEKIEKKLNLKFKQIFELIVFSFLLTILIVPGLFYTDVIAHEFYHYAMHQDITEEICIDINKPYWGHVKVTFENEEELLKYESEQSSKEERNANLCGHIASGIYLINSLIVVNWMLILTLRRQKKK